MLLVIDDLITGVFSGLLLPLHWGSIRYCSQDKFRMDVIWIFGAAIDLSLRMGEGKLLIFLYGGVILCSFAEA